MSTLFGLHLFQMSSSRLGAVAGVAALGALAYYLLKRRTSNQSNGDDRQWIRPAEAHPAEEDIEQLIASLNKRDIAKVPRVAKILSELLASAKTVENDVKALLLKVIEILGFTNQKPPRDSLNSLCDSAVEISEQFPSLRLEALDLLLELTRDKTRKGFPVPQRVIDYVIRVLADNEATTALAQRVCKVAFFLSAHAENRQRLPVKAVLICLDRHQKSSGVVLDAMSAISSLATSCSSIEDLNLGQKAVLNIYVIHVKQVEVSWRALMAFHSMGAGSPTSKELWAANEMTRKVFESLESNEGRSKALVEWTLKNLIDLGIRVTPRNMEIVRKTAKSPDMAAFANLLQNQQ